MSTKFRAQIVKENNVSSREAQVIELTVKGLSNKEIGNQLFITEKTVKFHLSNIYKSVGVSSRAQLIVKFLPQLTWENLGHG